MKASTKAIRFLETLAIPEGPKAGELIKSKRRGMVAINQKYQTDFKGEQT
jgi:hypothetical protein